ncbi:phosphotransferase family protein [Microbacterium aurum]
MPTAAQTLERLSPEAVEAALRDSGAVASAARLQRVTSAPIGIGALADTYLVHLHWSDPDAVPGTLVAKLPSTDAQSAATAASIGAYEREVRFYLELAPRTKVRVPRCLGSIELDDDGVGLLLEDLTTLTPGDQLSDTRPELIRAAREELAALQAPFWDDPEVAALDWLHRRQGVPIPGIAERMRTSWRSGADRLAGGFDPAERAVIDRFVEHADAWAGSLDGPFTLCHHDFRMDNMLTGGRRVVVLDWQTAGWGSPMFDVAYLLGTSTNPQRRAALERDELRRHVDELAARGVEWSWDAAWDAYRKAAFAVLLMLVPASGSVKRSERMEAMYRRLLRFGARQALDLDSAEFLPGG